MRCIVKSSDKAGKLALDMKCQQLQAVEIFRRDKDVTHEIFQRKAIPSQRSIQSVEVS